MPDIDTTFSTTKLHTAIVRSERAKLRLLEVLDHAVPMARNPTDEQWNIWCDTLYMASLELQDAFHNCKEAHADMVQAVATIKRKRKESNDK